MSNPKVQVGQKSDPSKQPKPLKNDSVSSFSEDRYEPALIKSTSLVAVYITVPTRIGVRRNPN